MSGAEPLMCYVNVQKRIKAMGGKMAFGWCVREDWIAAPASRTDAPSSTGQKRSNSSGTKLPKTPGHHVAKACECMTIADNLLVEGDLDKCRYWTEKANQHVRRAGYDRRWTVPASLDMADVLPTMLET